jgi:hypothetical protein
VFELVVELFFYLGELGGGESCEVDCKRGLAGSRDGEDGDNYWFGLLVMTWWIGEGLRCGGGEMDLEQG